MHSDRSLSLGPVVDGWETTKTNHPPSGPYIFHPVSHQGTTSQLAEKLQLDEDVRKGQVAHSSRHQGLCPVHRGFMR